jgi:metal-responsive CopG/Arc/MetJ family transcriptional regulator
MKTAISIPDETFEEASTRAVELGISRSEFFVRAAQRYLQALDDESLTQQIDAVLVLVGDDDSNRDAVLAGVDRLNRDEEW